MKENEDIELVRLKADIQDLSLAGLSPFLTLQRESVVGISKHLCGAATDLTIRYCVDIRTASPFSTKARKKPRILAAGMPTDF